MKDFLKTEKTAAAELGGKKNPNGDRGRERERDRESYKAGE